MACLMAGDLVKQPAWLGMTQCWTPTVADVWRRVDDVTDRANTDLAEPRRLHRIVVAWLELPWWKRLFALVNFKP